eukprot:scaffold3721_cov134-Isochrysis_galbana.AAC.16
MWLVPRIFDSRYLVCEPGQVAPIVFLEHSSGGLPDLAQLAHDVSADLPQQILFCIKSAGNMARGGARAVAVA